MTHDEIHEYCLTLIAVTTTLGILAAAIGGIIWMIQSLMEVG